MSVCLFSSEFVPGYLRILYKHNVYMHSNDPGFRTSEQVSALSQSQFIVFYTLINSIVLKSSTGSAAFKGILASIALLCSLKQLPIIILMHFSGANCMQVTSSLVISICQSIWHICIPVIFYLYKDCQLFHFYNSDFMKILYVLKLLQIYQNQSPPPKKNMKIELDFW